MRRACLRAWCRNWPSGPGAARLPRLATRHYRCRSRLCAAHAEIGAQLGSSAAFGSGCGQALPGVPRKAPLCLSKHGNFEEDLEGSARQAGRSSSGLLWPRIDRERSTAMRCRVGDCTASRSGWGQCSDVIPTFQPAATSPCCEVGGSQQQAGQQPVRRFSISSGHSLTSPSVSVLFTTKQ